MFRESDVLIISKTDVAPYFDFDFEKCIERARKLNPDIIIIPLSAKTGEGFDEWENWLLGAVKEWKGAEK